MELWISSGLRFSPYRLEKSESEVAQLCPTLYDPMDCSLPGSSVHGIFQARVLEWVAISFSRGSFLTQGSNLGLLHCRQMLYHLSHHNCLTVVNKMIVSSNPGEEA